MSRKSQLNAFRFDAAENVFLEASRPAKEFVLGRRHREKIEARGGVCLMQHPGFVDENAQYSLAQSASLENISDGNRFSSLKAKNILRFSVIPSFRKTSVGIIAYFPGRRKGVNDFQESRKLAETRDALFAKLMSGELEAA